MAGFGVFRNYQKASLVALAILSMLAFFVLPPLLQFGGRSASVADTPVVTWNGGELRESGLDRAVTMRRVVNRFLAEATMAAGRDPAQSPQFPADEQRVVRTMLLAEEARKNGIVVSDAAINNFLGQVTSGLVRPEQFEQIMQGLRAGAAGVSQHDLFESLRQELMAQNMLILLQRGFSGDPPGQRWDYFRRMEQSATVEVVPIDVRSVADQVKLPGEAALNSFFAKHREDLPDPRSDKPGFREPHRAKVEYLIAKQGTYLDEVAKEITDEQIAEYYEQNKATMFRARPGTPDPAAPPTGDAPATPATDDAPAAEPPPSEPPASEPAPPAAEPAAEPAPSEPAPSEPAPSEPAPSQPAPSEPAPSEPAEPAPGAAISRSPFRNVAYQAEPAGTAQEGEPPAAAADATPAASDTPAPAATEPASDVAVPATAEPPSPADAPAATDAPAAGDATQFEPLEAVKERIRDTLARQKATARIENVFDAVALDLSRYTEDLALWEARGKAQGQKAPSPPDFDVIAKVQGLEAARSELQSAEQAFEAGGIGRSFEFVPDPGSRFGVRQQNWLEMIYGQGAVGLRGIKSRDMEGNRYLSWRTEDQPEFVPTFKTARPLVEQAWKIVEGRPLARKRAEEIADKAAGAESLEAAIAGDESLEAVKAGPFFWLSPQAAASGVAQVSQPAGIVMPGDEFMEAVFSLEPGKTAVAFNEPKTVCYVIRLIDVEPPVDRLRERFVESRADPRLTGVAAQDDFSKSFGTWVEGLESRYKLDWKRKPRR